MKSLYTQLERPTHGPSKPLVLAKLLRGSLLFPFAYAAGRVMGGPGGALHLNCARLALAARLTGANISLSQLYQLIINPFDSVRYFEFDFAIERIGSSSLTSLLDVSSPRLLPLLILSRWPELRATLCNPDGTDLAETQRLAGLLGLDRRCIFHGSTVDSLPAEQDTFDLVTSISVIEHIPDDSAALREIWRRVRPGGRLILTLPCSREAMAEYIDFNEYGLLANDAAGFTFGQRFYDEALLASNIFAVTGEPVTTRVYGEKRPGLFFADRAKKNRSHLYSDYLEYLRMARDWQLFPSVASLPGLGVVGLEFIKRAD